MLGGPVRSAKREHAQVGTPEPVHPRLAALAAALDHEGARWCLLRGETDLLAPAGDVDLLVHPEDFARLRRLAVGLGFAPLPAWGYGSHAFFLTYDASGDLWLKLDVVTELAFGPAFSLATGAEREVLTRRRYVNGVPVPAPDDAFWALLLHELLDKQGPVGRDEAARLAELAREGGEEGPLARLVQRLCPPEWSAEGISSAVERGDWASLAGLAPRLAAAWRRHASADVRTRLFAAALARRTRKWLRFGRRRGLGVALLGPDGAGKSTVATEVGRSFYFPVRSVYMGLYQRPPGPVPARAAPRGGLPRRLARQWGRWLEGAYHRRRGRLVLFDRYSYEALVPGRNRPSTRGRVRRWLLGHSCPPPDLVVLLDAPAELLYARKGEHDVALLERQREAYRALVTRLPRTAVVDGSRDVDVVRRDVIGAIWNEYARRWSAPR